MPVLKNDDNSKKFRLPDGLNEQMVKLAQQISKQYMPLIQIELPRISDAFRETQLAFAKTMTKLVQSRFHEDLKKITDAVGKLSERLDGHFPDNWPKDKMRESADLCVKGVPIVFAPRKEVVSKILLAKDMTGIKQVIVRNGDDIIADCENLFVECDWLSKDMREHISESVESYKSGRYRAAQSTAIIAFDALLNEVVDMKAWRKQKRSKRVLSANVVKKYTDVPGVDLMDIPLGRAPFYTILMLPIIGQMLAMFELGDKSTYMNNANRHMSSHTVSAKQYKKSNALLTIMTIASICKVTRLQGKYWLQNSTSAYGFSFVEDRSNQ